MPRLAISIPEDLEKLLEEYREHLSDTVSRICQEALFRALRAKEKALSGDGQMTMVARLQEQSQDTREETKQEGRLQGIDWATNNADWDDLVIFKEVIEGDGAGGSYDWKSIRDIIEDRWWDGYEEAQKGMFFDDWIEGFAHGAVDRLNEAMPDIEASSD